jgi:hypothetical protein
MAYRIWGHRPQQTEDGRMIIQMPGHRNGRTATGAAKRYATAHPDENVVLDFGDGIGYYSLDRGRSFAISAIDLFPQAFAEQR